MITDLNNGKIVEECPERCEEVQAIIDRMPTVGATWVAVITGILIGMIFLLGFIIKYPDTVDGQITITLPVTLRCGWLPLKDVRYLIVGIVGCSKMKALLDFLPSKVYLDRMSIRVDGHSRESAIREIMQDVAGHLFDIHELESFVEEGKADR